MGEEFDIQSSMISNRYISVGAYGTVSIEKAEIIKNGHILYSRSGNGVLDMKFSYIDKGAESTTDYYYVHIIQIDGEQAWSSPIWVNTQV